LEKGIIDPNEIGFTSHRLDIGLLTFSRDEQA